MSEFGPAPSVLLGLAGPDTEGLRTPERQMREAEAHPGLPTDAALLRPERWMAEVTRFPVETELPRRAPALGCRTVDGGGMAVFQAAAPFRRLTGRDPAAASMPAQFRSMDA